jgi:hypothetical protein
MPSPAVLACLAGHHWTARTRLVRVNCVNLEMG